MPECLYLGLFGSGVHVFSVSHLSFALTVWILLARGKVLQGREVTDIRTKEPSIE